MDDYRKTNIEMPMTYYFQAYEMAGMQVTCNSRQADRSSSSSITACSDYESGTAFVNDLATCVRTSSSGKRGNMVEL